MVRLFHVKHANSWSPPRGNSLVRVGKIPLARTPSVFHVKHSTRHLDWSRCGDSDTYSGDPTLELSHFFSLTTARPTK
jgi:hypothetical protein